MAAIVGVSWAFSGRPEFALIVISIIAGFAAVYLFGTWIFSHFHPDLALLGDAELLKWRQMDMGAKGIQIPINQPNTTPPLLTNEHQEK
jgi:hypothetical protein